METVVVTGGAGFIGHHLVTRLLVHYKVVILDNFSRGLPERLDNIKGDYEVYRCDITNETELANCLDHLNIFCLFHLAAINGTDNFYKIPIQIMDVGIIGCLNICRYVQTRGIPKLVLASSAEVYQDCHIVPTPEDVPLLVPNISNPRYSYGLSKIYTEYYSYHFGKQFGLDLCIFRPHNVYGPNMGLKHVIPEFLMQFLTAKLLNKNCVLKPKGPLFSVRTFCFVDDIVNGIILLAEKNKGANVYNLGSTHSMSMYELVNAISEDLDVECEIQEGEDSHVGSTKLRCPDITKALSLGYVCQTEFPEGLKRTTQWYKSNYVRLIGKPMTTY